MPGPYHGNMRNKIRFGNIHLKGNALHIDFYDPVENFGGHFFIRKYSLSKIKMV